MLPGDNCDVVRDQPSTVPKLFDAIGTKVGFMRGVTLFREGSSVDHVFFLAAGRVKLFATSREGKTMIFRMAAPGELLGLSGALSNTAHELTAETREPCDIRVIQITDFLLFIEQHPVAGLFAVKCLLGDYRNAFKSACRLGLPGSAAGRLAGFLLDWPTRTLEGCRERHLLVRLTHQEIASMTAMTRETVSRTLRQFQRKKLISMKGSSLIVHCPEVLQELAA